MWRLTWQTIPYLRRTTVEQSEPSWFMRGENNVSASAPSARVHRRTSCAKICIFIDNRWELKWTVEFIMHEYVWHHHEIWLTEFNDEQMQMQSDVNTHHEHTPSLVNTHDEHTPSAHTEESHVRSSDRHLITQTAGIKSHFWVTGYRTAILQVQKFSNQMWVSRLSWFNELSEMI